MLAVRGHVLMHLAPNHDHARQGKLLQADPGSCILTGTDVWCRQIADAAFLFFGRDVLANRTDLETAFCETSNALQIPELKMRTRNYTMHPSQTPGASRSVPQNIDVHVYHFTCTEQCGGWDSLACCEEWDSLVDGM